ncbi:MAG: hypothetical protein ACE5KM_16390 [Planctomycetaceae bacterium]
MSVLRGVTCWLAVGSLSGLLLLSAGCKKKTPKTTVKSPDKTPQKSAETSESETTKTGGKTKETKTAEKTDRKTGGKTKNKTKKKTGPGKKTRANPGGVKKAGKVESGTSFKARIRKRKLGR